MAVKVAINGFGRIGRLAFRQMFGAEGYESRRDQRSDQPRDAGAPAEVRHRAGPLRRPHEWRPARTTSPSTARRSPSIKNPNPAELPWGELGVDVVLECTGFFTKQGQGHGSHRRRRQEGRHLRPGRQRPEDHRLQREREHPDRRKTRSSPPLPAPPTAWPRWRRP